MNTAWRRRFSLCGFGLAVTILAFSQTASSQTASSQPAGVPRKAPPLTIRFPGDKSTPLSSYSGKVVLLAFLNYGCQSCEKFAGVLDKVAREYRSKGVEVIGVLFEKDAKDHATAFHQKFAQDFPVGYSDETTVLGWLAQPVDQGYFTPIIAFVSRGGILESQHMADDLFFGDPDKNIRLTLDKLTARPRRYTAK